MPDFAVILPAAGRSLRFGSAVGKLFQRLGDRPVLAWTLAAFARRPDVRQIVVPANDVKAIEECAEFLTKLDRRKLKICSGGTCRADSVRAGLMQTAPEIEWIAVHDAARPLVSQQLIDRTIALAEKHGAAAAAVGVHLSIKQAAGPLPAAVQRTVPRHQLWAMQTPQVARRRDFLAAFESCPLPLAEVTDDIQLLELAGQPVWLAEGEEANLKVTTPLDLRIAELLISGGNS